MYGVWGWESCIVVVGRWWVVWVWVGFGCRVRVVRGWGGGGGGWGGGGGGWETDHCRFSSANTTRNVGH